MGVKTGMPVTGKDFYKSQLFYVELLHKKLSESEFGAVYLLGPRRIGKTSIVQEYFRQRRNDKSDLTLYVYVYCSNVKNVLGFYRNLNTEFFNTLKAAHKLPKYRRILPSLASVRKKFVEFGNRITSLLKEIKLGWIKIGLCEQDMRQKYESELEKTFEVFLDLLISCKTERVVFGFDEVPEAFQKILKNSPEYGKDEINTWLEHFRMLRHKGHKDIKIGTILFGSVNMRMTLERLGITKAINDSNSMSVGYMPFRNVKGLFWKLARSEDLKDLIDGKNEVNDFLKKNLSPTSPWAVHVFLDECKNTVQETFDSIKERLIAVYYRVLDNQHGPKYTKERFKNYYTTDEITRVIVILRTIVRLQIVPIQNYLSRCNRYI